MVVIFVSVRENLLRLLGRQISPHEQFSGQAFSLSFQCEVEQKIEEVQSSLKRWEQPFRKNWYRSFVLEIFNRKDKSLWEYMST